MKQAANECPDRCWKLSAMKLVTVMLSCAMLVCGLSARAQPSTKATAGKDDAKEKKSKEMPEKIEPRFEPREKFGSEEPVPRKPATLSAEPPCGDVLYLGQRGTFHLLGTSGKAHFLWPLDGRPAKAYEEHMVFLYRTDDVAVYKLVGQFYRVCFAFAVRADSSGRQHVWIKNGDAKWREFQTPAAGQPQRR